MQLFGAGTLRYVFLLVLALHLIPGVRCKKDSKDEDNDIADQNQKVRTTKAPKTCTTTTITSTISSSLPSPSSSSSSSSTMLFQQSESGSSAVIVLSVLVVLMLVGIILYYFWRWKRRQPITGPYRGSSLSTVYDSNMELRHTADDYEEIKDAKFIAALCAGDKTATPSAPPLEATPQNLYSTGVHGPEVQPAPCAAGTDRTADHPDNPKKM